MAARAPRREAASAADPTGPGPGAHAAPGSGAGPGFPPFRPKRRTGGVAVVAGGLLQDLEERLRRDLAPVELRVRPGEELRGLSSGPAGGPADPLVVVLPPRDAGKG